MVITKKSSLDSLYKNLPVIIIDKWDSLLDINFLRKKYDRLKPLLKKEYIDKCFEQNYWL
jgi:hypothetical protein